MSFLSIIDNWQYRRNSRASAESGRGSSFLNFSKRRAKTDVSECKSFIDEEYNWVSALKNYYCFDGPSDDSKTKQIRTASTLPALSKTARIPKFRRPSLHTFDTASRPRRASSLRSPDRFLPRRPTLDTVESFHSNQDPEMMSTEEKLTRTLEASPDAFDTYRRASSPVPGTTRASIQPTLASSRGGGGSVLAFRRDPPGPTGSRQVSVGTIWAVGGLAPGVSSAISNGRGGLLTSGSNAPLYQSRLSAARSKAKEQLEHHERRLAQALDMDRISRVFEFRDLSLSPPKPEIVSKSAKLKQRKTVWTGSEWVSVGPERKHPVSLTQEVRNLPEAPFKVLDAPNLRDDFYCSVLAYSATCHTLAVGLGSLLYAWSEMAGVHLLNSGTSNGSWLTSLAFSSTQGTKAILAFGRSDGTLNLMSLYDSMLPRFEVQHPTPIACVKWRPVVTMRPSRSPLTPGMLIRAEDLVVGDEIGNIYYYSVEWPDKWEVGRDGWSGSMTLLARVSIHTQQICGLSFSYDGALFATGGNDNLCCLFRTEDVLEKITKAYPQVDNEEVFIGVDGMRRVHTVANRGQVKKIESGSEKHRWVHGAAVKAIAFCPWRPGLVATGGGSNDKCIHFYHTTSGACLATISVAAQVTSLIWSTTRREICATFGYAQPEHPYRIAVFSWPECKQVAAIAWEGEHRALYAIPYPGGPNESSTNREGPRGLSRTAKEGCIVVASSDESVKFHEVWSANPKATTGGEGLLGGSDILEGLEGIDKEGEVIR